MRKTLLISIVVFLVGVVSLLPILASAQLLGDVNKDGKVDILDITEAALAFGSKQVDDPTTPWNEARNWNPDADLDGNGVINIFDLVIIAVNF